MTSTASNTIGSTKALSSSEREHKFNAIYKQTHEDFKGTLKDGTKTMLSWAKYGFGLCCLDSISDDELNERYAAIKNRKR